VASLKDYLMLFRAHTAPATVIALMASYLIAGGRDLLVAVLLFLLGHLVHFFSFGHNSLMDYWVDKEDLSKAHHPLPSGRISLESATKVVLYGQAIAFVLFALLIMRFSQNPALSLLFLCGFIVFGHAYNDGLDHRTEHSYLPIALAYACFPLISYTFVRGLDFLALVLSLWAFLFNVYDIALVGNAKDVWNPIEKHNPLRKRAVLDERGNVIGIKRGIVWGLWSLRGIVSTAIAYFVLYLVNLSLPNFALLTLLTVVELYSTIAMCREVTAMKLNRLKVLRFAGLSEAVEFFRIASIIAMPWPLILMAYGMGYFVCFNKLLWGTKLAPRV
jgi:4-hydroxybenzoate polyprenyltransferase